MDWPASRQPRRILWPGLSRVSYANVNHLQPNDLYRVFECLPLRHAVWTAENSHRHFRQNSRILPVFRDSRSTNRTAESGLPQRRLALIHLFRCSDDKQSNFHEFVRRRLWRSDSNSGRTRLDFFPRDPGVVPMSGLPIYSEMLESDVQLRNRQISVNGIPSRFLPTEGIARCNPFTKCTLTPG